MKYALPTNDGKTVSDVFGRAASFALYDTIDGSFAIVPNSGGNSEHGAGTGAASFLAEQGVKAVIAPEVGPKASAALVQAGIKILAAQEGKELGESLADYLVSDRVGKSFENQ